MTLSPERFAAEVAEALAAFVIDEAVDSFLGEAAQTRKWKALEPAQTRFVRTLEQMFLEQGKLFLSKVAKDKASLRLQEAEAEPWEPYWDEAALESLDQFSGNITSGLTEALAVGSMQALGSYGSGISFSLDNPRATSYLANQAFSAVEGINNTTRDQLRAMFAVGRTEGASYEVMADRLLQQFAHWATPQPQQHIKSRAHLIAVNELASAYEAGNSQVAQHLLNHGLDMVKRWLVGKPSGADRLCREAEREGWMAMDGLFQGRVQHAPMHPACRCTVEYQRNKNQCGCPPMNSVLVGMTEAYGGLTIKELSSLLGVSTGTAQKVSAYASGYGYTIIGTGTAQTAYMAYKSKTPPGGYAPPIASSPEYTGKPNTSVLTQPAPAKPQGNAAANLQVPQPATPKQYLTPAEAAKQFGIKPQKIYQLAKSGKFQFSSKPGDTKKMVNTDKLKAALHAHNAPAGQSYVQQQVKQVHCTKADGKYHDFKDNAAAKAWAKQNFSHSFTREERGALSNYQGSAYAGINALLRGTTNRSFMRIDAIQRETARIMSAMKKNAIGESVVVHRGDGLGMIGMGGRDPNSVLNSTQGKAEMSAQVGKIVSDPGFMSTSIGSKAAFNTKNVQLTLKVPKGHPAVYMDDIDDIGEREILLGAGTKYVIQKVEFSDTRFGVGTQVHITAEVVP